MQKSRTIIDQKIISGNRNRRNVVSRRVSRSRDDVLRYCQGTVYNLFQCSPGDIPQATNLKTRISTRVRGIPSPEWVSKEKNFCIDKPCLRLCFVDPPGRKILRCELKSRLSLSARQKWLEVYPSDASFTERTRNQQKKMRNLELHSLKPFDNH